MNVQDQLKLVIMKNLQDIDSKILSIVKNSKKTAIIPGPAVLEESLKNSDKTYFNLIEEKVLKSSEETRKLKELYTKRDALITILKSPDDFMTLLKDTIESLTKFVKNMEEL